MSTPDRLTDEEKEALRALAGCGCCSSTHEATALWPDDCPTEGGYTFHAYGEGCVADDGIVSAVERILAARLAAQPPATDRDALVRAADEIEAERVRLHESGVCQPRQMGLVDAERIVRTLAARPAPVCDTCDGDGETLAMVPGSTGEPVEGMVPCPDCVAQRPRNDGIARPAPDTLADRVQALADEHRPDGGVEGPGAMCVACTPGFGTVHEDPVAYPCTVARTLDALLAGRSDASPEAGA